MTGGWDDLDVPLEGRLVALEPLRADHEPELLVAAQADEIWAWMPTDVSSPPAMGAWIAECLALAERRERQHFATRLLATGEVVGSTSYCLIQPENRTVEIGWT